MDGKKITNATQGLLTAILYCCSVYIAWHASFDQWYLPAGLRIAALLFLPYRLLPWMLLADVAALSALRIPAITAQGVDPVWAYSSPWVLPVLIAVVPLLIRAQINTVHRVGTRLVPMLLLIAVWGAACTIGVNIIFDGPASTFGSVKFTRFVVGDYLGMLMVVLPVMLWLRRHDAGSRYLCIHGAAAGLATAVLFCIAALSGDNAIRPALTALLILPAIVLTCLHGWRGAAIGVVLANVATAYLLRTDGTMGGYDPSGFLAQVLLATAATGLVVLGARISSAVAEARAKAQAERQARLDAQSSYLLAERSLRERVIGYVDIHVHINRLRRDIETYLRSRGQHEAALRMIRTGYIQSQMLDEYIRTLYPLEIETHGLYHIFRSVGFANACNTEIHAAHLRGRPQQLSVGLQLAAYRCTLQAVACLPPATRHMLKARAGKTQRFQGIAISLCADPLHMEPTNKARQDAITELSSRIRAHGGALRHHHACRISFLIAEAVDTSSLFRSDEPGIALGRCL